MGHPFLAGRFGATPHYTLIQGLYWMIYCILVSFSSVYLLEHGFLNTQIGILLSVSSILSALIQPVAAAKADQMKKLSLRQLCALLMLAMGGCAAGLLLLSNALIQGGLYMLLLILLQLLMPFQYALGMDCVNNHIPLNFGLARSFGSITYGLASSLCGILATRYGAGILPLLLLCLSALFLPTLLSFRFSGPVGKTLPHQEVLEPEDHRPFLKKYKTLPPLLLGIILLFTSHNILMSFPYQIVQSLGGGSMEMGQLLTVQCMVEIPIMVFFAPLLRRASSRFWVRISSVSFFLHALLIWLSPNLTVLLAVQIFEMTGYALYAVASVYFVNQLIDLPDRVQGQTYFSMTNTIGLILGSFVGGLLLDYAGVSALLSFATLTGAGGMILLLMLLRTNRTQVPVQQAQP